MIQCKAERQRERKGGREEEGGAERERQTDRQRELLIFSVPSTRTRTERVRWGGPIQQPFSSKGTPGGCRKVYKRKLFS
jgi:hypothetical protein